jgi:hypothetical protein
VELDYASYRRIIICANVSELKKYAVKYLHEKRGK